jgi:hypothetical protein
MKGRLGQTQEVGGSCAAFNPLGTRDAGKVQLNRQSSQKPYSFLLYRPCEPSHCCDSGWVGWVGIQNFVLPEGGEAVNSRVSNEYVHNFAGHLSIYENRYLFCKADKERYIANNDVELQMRKVEMQMRKGG